MSSKIYLSIILLLVIGSAFKYFEMSATITTQQARILNYEKSMLSYQVDIQTERQNVNILKDSISGLNREIKKLQVKNTKVLEEYNKYLSKPIQERFTGKTQEFILSPLWNSNNCQDAHVINQTISELRLEDL